MNLKTMDKAQVADLCTAVERLHDCQATFRDYVYVVEDFQDQRVWQGYVYLFDLSGHSAAKLCYAWSAPIEGSSKRKFYAVLHQPPVESPADAVRAAIRSEFK